VSAEAEKSLKPLARHGWVWSRSAASAETARIVPVPRFTWPRPKRRIEAPGIRLPVVQGSVAADHAQSDSGGSIGIANEGSLGRSMNRFTRGCSVSEGVVIAEMLSGQELIIGRQVDVPVRP